MKFVIIALLALPLTALAEMFDKFVASENFIAECSASPEHERGPFGLVVKEKNKEHHLLVMTGVYYETCKDFERDINNLRKKFTHLRIIGTEGHVESPTVRVWRWRSVRTLQGAHCISYFEHDCPKK